MKIDKKIIVNALIALVVYAAVMGLVKGGVLSRQMMSLITPGLRLCHDVCFFKPGCWFPG